MEIEDYNAFVEEAMTKEEAKQLVEEAMEYGYIDYLKGKRFPSFIFNDPQLCYKNYHLEAFLCT